MTDDFVVDSLSPMNVTATLSDARAPSRSGVGVRATHIVIKNVTKTKKQEKMTKPPDSEPEC